MIITRIRTATILLATIAVLLETACASQDLPYDAPQVGKDGVAQVLGVERYEGYENSEGRMIEVVIWRTVREDGRECDEVSMKVTYTYAPDYWSSLHRDCVPDAIQDSLGASSSGWCCVWSPFCDTPWLS